MPWIFFCFCRPQRRTAVYRPEGGYPVHLSRPLFAAVRPKNGRKSTSNHLYTCVNTNAVFAATFPCILFRFWRQKKSTAVYCGNSNSNNQIFIAPYASYRGALRYTGRRGATVYCGRLRYSGIPMNLRMMHPQTWYLHSHGTFASVSFVYTSRGAFASGNFRCQRMNT